MFIVKVLMSPVAGDLSISIFVPSYDPRETMCTSIVTHAQEPMLKMKLNSARVDIYLREQLVTLVRVPFPS